MHHAKQQLPFQHLTIVNIINSLQGLTQKLLTQDRLADMMIEYINTHWDHLQNLTLLSQNELLSETKQAAFLENNLTAPVLSSLASAFDRRIVIYTANEHYAFGRSLRKATLLFAYDTKNGFTPLPPPPMSTLPTTPIKTEILSEIASLRNQT